MVSQEGLCPCSGRTDPGGEEAHVNVPLLPVTAAASLQQTWWNGTWSNLPTASSALWLLIPGTEWTPPYMIQSRLALPAVLLEVHLWKCHLIGLSLKIRNLKVKSILPWRFPRCTTRRTHFPIEYCTYCSDKIRISAPETKQEEIIIIIVIFIYIKERNAQHASAEFSFACSLKAKKKKTCYGHLIEYSWYPGVEWQN